MRKHRVERPPSRPTPSLRDPMSPLEGGRLRHVRPVRTHSSGEEGRKEGTESECLGLYRSIVAG